jgi:hypothetical protein
MRWFIFRLIAELSYIWKPCPRIASGYDCKRYESQGCECGRRWRG